MTQALVTDGSAGSLPGDDPGEERYGAVVAGTYGHDQVVNLDRFLPYKVSRLANYLSRSLAHLYGDDHGLTVTEWRLLAVVARSGRCSAIDVCRATAMDKVRVSRAVASALDKGLLTRTHDAADRRRRVLRLTKKGGAVHDAIVPRVAERQGELLGGFEPVEVETLFGLLDRLTEVARTLPGADEPAAQTAD